MKKYFYLVFFNIFLIMLSVIIINIFDYFNLDNDLILATEVLVIPSLIFSSPCVFGLIIGLIEPIVSIKDYILKIIINFILVFIFYFILTRIEYMKSLPYMLLSILNIVGYSIGLLIKNILVKVRRKEKCKLKNLN